MPEFDKIYLYRMTHIENIPHILQHGITHSTSVNANSDYKTIGDTSLISTRSNFTLVNGRHLGEYIPFYFGKRTPMLYVIQRGYNTVVPTLAESIVYCVTSVQKIIEQRLDFVFTDGHALDRITNQFTAEDLQNIDTLINRQAVEAKYWKSENDLDFKRKKEAEFLVLGDITLNAILGYLVYNENAKNRMISYGIPSSNIHIKSEDYF